MDENSARVAQCISPVIGWFRRVCRPLPWREGRDPYRVWVSEIMLQQTRIEAVLPYYERFLRALPTVEALADVDDDRLLKLWEGLGYYSRARNLKKAARIVVEQYGGSLPDGAEELKKLPGVGEYTAGAVASIAFGQPVPAVDGNVLRVLSRVLACPDDIGAPRTRAAMTALLAAHYPAGEDAGLLTQGLMELGQRMCLPGEPECAGCPLAELCLARLRGQTADYPVRKPKKPRRVQARTVLLLQSGRKTALARRGDTGLLAGLWELPGADGALDREGVLALARDWGCAPGDAAPVSSGSHIFTHVQWEMTLWRVPCGAESDRFTWVTAAELEKSYPLPSAFRAFRPFIE